ncbi:MAG: cyclic nucleotide-binding domain-containing protein [Lachnospiraceae bacterium]|nr:cyclic nucleotide-binding domain-containing protein [Lachnospiraceae bacterium]
MAVVNIEKGKHFIKSGDKVTELYWIVQGSVLQVLSNKKIVIEKGHMIGLAEGTTGVFTCDYVTNEDCVIYSYQYEKEEDLKKIFEAQPKNAVVFLMSAVRGADATLRRYAEHWTLCHKFYTFTSELYRQYKIICEKLKIEEKPFSKMDYFEPLSLETKVRKSKIDYFASLAKMPKAIMDAFYGKDNALIVGEIIHAGECMNQSVPLIEEMYQYLLDNQDILLNEQKNDLFALYFDLTKRAAAQEMELALFQKKIMTIVEFAKMCKIYDKESIETRFAEFESYDFSKAAEEVSKAEQEEAEEEIEEPPMGDEWLTYILKYASYDEEKCKRAVMMIEEYRELPDMYSTSDEVRKLRRDIAKMFYDVYMRVFKRSVKQSKIPTIVKMFLNFGFMDVTLAGEDNVSELYELAETIEEKCKSSNVYTAYEWLKSIYTGENEPSKNEFDLDYVGYLREQKRMGEITAAQEKAFLDDNWNKTVYEMDNMFKSTNRATYGKFATFQPALCEEDLINSPTSMLITVDRLNDALDYLRSVDYSLFYHEIVFSDPDHGITKETLQKEILPYIILMPNAGSRSMMWQETAGSRRDTPARFIMPILTVVEPREMMTELCGRYRWEMCRKIQGMRWNDVTERSLTSEYCDYMQFYRKNHDLSAETKEKIKNALVKAKNNYREVFVKDYQCWIKYEAKGSCRLNKVAREIVFTYCPFSKDIRKVLEGNPMYQNLFEKYEIFKQRKLRHVTNFYDKYQKSGGTITQEMQDNLDFYEL